MIAAAGAGPNRGGLRKRIVPGGDGGIVTPFASVRAAAPKAPQSSIAVAMAPGLGRRSEGGNGGPAAPE